MINETNINESMFLNTLQSKKRSEPSSFDDTKKHLRANSYEIGETSFRNSNLPIEANEKLHQKQIESLNKSSFKM